MKFGATLFKLGILSLLFALAVDLAVSVLGDYWLRVDAALLVLTDAVFLAPVVWGTLAGIYAAGRVLRRGNLLERAPWSSALLAGWLPVAAIQLYFVHGVGDIALRGVITIGLLIALVLESRRKESRMKPLPWAAASAVLLAIAIFIAAVPMPGSSMVESAGEPKGPVATAEAPNIVLIVLDTMRADHIGAYGYERPITPWLDAFAEKSTLFEHLVASSSYTLPTHATIFTGLYPESHGADRGDGPFALSLEQLELQQDRETVLPLPQQATTLAEMALNEGMETGAICANTAYLSRFFALDQGFETYVDQLGANTERRPVGLALAYRVLAERNWKFKRFIWTNEKYYLLGSEVNELTLRWLEPRRDRRFFLFVNYMEPHEPYEPVPGYRDLFPLSYADQRFDRTLIRTGERDILPEEKAPLIDAYDAEIRSLDDYLAALFARMEEWGLMDKTLVVITGDHGESFGENRVMSHGTSVYQPQVWVPLIYRKPGQTQGERISRRVAMADILPTVLADANIKDPGDLEGTPLFTEERKLPVVARLGPYERDYVEHAMYEGDWKFILRTNGEDELYNLKEDPEESNNVIADHLDIAEDMRRRIDDFYKVTVSRFEKGEGAMDPETIKRLRGLGYLK